MKKKRFLRTITVMEFSSGSGERLSVAGFEPLNLNNPFLIPEPVALGKSFTAFSNALGWSGYYLVLCTEQTRSLDTLYSSQS